MKTPNGSPSVPVTARRLGFGAGDAAVQAASGEATVVNTNQDLSRTGAADARSGQATQKAGVANQPGPKPFTRED